MKKILLIFSLTVLVLHAFCAPDWSVNTADYEFSMTIIGEIDYNGKIGAENDMVAVFINNECRGVTTAIFDTDYNKYVFYLTIFSNQYNGEELSVKFYQNSSDETFTDLPSIAFTDGANVGTAQSPLNFIDGYTNINQANQILQTNIYPNPVSDVFTIPEEVSGNIEIYSINGKLVEQFVITSKTVMVDNLHAGLYVIKYTNKNNQDCIARFIKN